MSLNLALNTALSGLLTTQKGLDVVSNNISNVNTEGYTRKTFSAESRVVNGVGAGVQTGGITRNVESWLTKDVREARGLYSQLDTANTYMSRVQDLFGTPSENSSLSHMIGELGNEMELFALETDKSPQSAQVVQNAVQLATKFNTMSSQLQALRTDADRAIEAGVNDINAILSNIDTLNDQISVAFATGQTTADLLDKRDSELSSLGELIDVTYYERESGAVVVFTKSGSLLVDSEANSLTHASLSSVTPSDTHGAGSFDGIKLGAADITEDVRSGKLKALIDLRDGELPNLQAQIDELAQTLRTTLNEIHNRGNAYPAQENSFQGSRRFLSDLTGGGTHDQTFDVTSGDVAISLFDTEGNQAATTTLSALMGGTASGTMEDLATNLETWLTTTGGLTAADVAFDSEGRMTIDLGTSAYSLAMRDQATSVPGSDMEDVSIDFDADADGNVDETYTGFANFLGLNDFYSKAQSNTIWDSETKADGYTQLASFSMRFSMGDSGTLGTILVQAGDSLEDVAERINADTTMSQYVQAAVIKDGTGYRLRIRGLDSDELMITATGGASNSGWTALGMDRSAVGEAADIRIADDLLASSDNLARGAVQYNSDTGEFYLSSGDNTVANQMAAAFNSKFSYDAAGGLSTGSLAFSDYAASIISGASSRASTVETQLSYQQSLKESLELKSSEISDVNLDEEMAQLLVYQQAYSAAAKVISTTAKLFEILDSIVQ